MFYTMLKQYLTKFYLHISYSFSGPLLSEVKKFAGETAFIHHTKDLAFDFQLPCNNTLGRLTSLDYFIVVTCEKKPGVFILVAVNSKIQDKEINVYQKSITKISRILREKLACLLQADFPYILPVVARTEEFTEGNINTLVSAKYQDIRRFFEGPLVQCLEDVKKIKNCLLVQKARVTKSATLSVTMAS